MNAPGTALVTGASQGIGSVYADRLARRGYDLLLVARNRALLEERAERLAAATGRRVETALADLGSAEGAAAVAERLRTDDRIDFLVNNAGVGRLGPALGADPDRVDAMLQVNVAALTRLSGAAADAFAARGRGTIINLASVFALHVRPYAVSYIGSKAYVLAYTRSLAEELAPRGVRVQVVLPGAVATAIWDGSGVDLGALPEDSVMPVDALVDAAFAGLDRGETVTLPTLPDAALWDALEAARQDVAADLQHGTPAARYRSGS